MNGGTSTRQITFLDSICANFPPTKCLLEKKFLENIKSGSLFGYVQCDIEVTENLREAFANFPPNYKKIIVGGDDIGPFMKESAEKEGILTQSRRMLTSSYFLENGTIITPLLLFYLDLGLVCKKIYRFVHYTPMKCFNNFVQSAMNIRREGDENPNLSVVAETMKAQANSSYVYQIMDRSQHTVTKYLSDQKHMELSITKCLNAWVYINDQLYEVELVKSVIQHKEPRIVGFFILQFAKLRMIERNYNFFDK